MSLSSAQLDAFVEVARTSSFSKAAANLHVTQSALSQRILNLEAELKAALFIRESRSVRLTAVGEELLRYCRTKDGLEQECVQHIMETRTTLAGTIRVGGFSSIMRSGVLPALSTLVMEHSNVKLELFNREIRDLLPMLLRNEVDVILNITPSQRADVETSQVGEEVYYMVESTKASARQDVYFDHDPFDETTAVFFQSQKGKKVRDFQRAYLDEIYAIIDAVAMGWGRAVIPRHLLGENKNIRVVEELTPLKIPVYLQYFRQPYYSKLHLAVLETLQTNLSRMLANS